MTERNIEIALAVAENVAILAAVCFLVWLPGRGWGALVLVLMNGYKVRQS